MRAGSALQLENSIENGLRAFLQAGLLEAAELVEAGDEQRGGAGKAIDRIAIAPDAAVMPVRPDVSAAKQIEAASQTAR